MTAPRVSPALSPHTSETPTAQVAAEFARGLLVAESGGNASAESTVAAAERVCVRVTTGLSGWFGPYGSHALITRALATARATHPVLAEVTISEEPCLSGLSDTARAHGAPAAAEAIVAVVAALGDLLARLIGDDLAIGLLEQSIAHHSFQAPGSSIAAPRRARPDDRSGAQAP
jgi:hypothetical protein